MISDDINQSLTIKSYDSASIEASFIFSGSETILRDHFPGTPVIPGVHLIALCRKAVEMTHRLTTSNLERAKFMKICTPGLRYTIKTSLTPMQAACSIYTPENQLCAKIILKLQSF